jgi:signal transduction histidine kinase
MVRRLGHGRNTATVPGHGGAKGAHAGEQQQPGEGQCQDADNDPACAKASAPDRDGFGVFLRQGRAASELFGKAEAGTRGAQDPGVAKECAQRPRHLDRVQETEIHGVSLLRVDGKASHGRKISPCHEAGTTLIFEVLDTAQIPEYEPRLRRALAGEAFPHEHEAHGRRYVSSGIPLRDGTGQIEGVLAFSHDITERSQREQNLHQAVMGKSELLAVLAHELRNPVAPMTYALEMIQLSGVPPTATQALDVLERQLEQIKRLIEDVADASQPSSSTLGLKRQRQAGAGLRKPPDERGEVHGRGGPCLDFRDLRAGRRSCLGSGHRHRHRTGDARACVRHVRPGGKFHSRSQDGIGIGLALVRRIVERHGGSVVLHSDGAGKGSRVQVRLPMRGD